MFNACVTDLGAIHLETDQCAPCLHLQPELLSDTQRQDLADVLPYLACGEVSAVHAFSGRLLKTVPADAQATLNGIANDEIAHARLIESLQNSLPPAQQPPDAARLAMFFRRLESSDPAEHLARVAALDRAVCQVLQPLLRQGCAISQSPAMYGAFRALRQDEARHVRMAREMARQLGLAASRQQQLDHSIRLRLKSLLAPVSEALARLSANLKVQSPEENF